MPYVIDVKKDGAQGKWKRLSVLAIAPDRLIDDLAPHMEQYAIEKQLNPDLISGRVVQIESSQIGSKEITFTRLMHLRESNATMNKAAQPINLKKPTSVSPGL